MNTYYFTYGTDEKFYPFVGGWTEVIAPTQARAIELYRQRYPDKREDLVNCACIYTEEEFRGCEMCKKGNFGKFCMDRLFDDSATIPIHTSAGILTVRPNTDNGAPGFSISINSDGRGEVELSYVEVKENPEYWVDDETEKDVCIYTYGDPLCDDYTQKIVVRGTDLEKAGY